MAENLTFPIPKELLEPFIQQAVSTSIISALGDGKELINRAVYETVKMKVDKHGEVSKYSSDNKYTLLDILAKNEIKRIVIDTVKISVEELRPQIIEGVKRALNENAEDLGSALVDRYLKDIYRSLGIAVTKPHAGYGEDDDD
jgi:CTP synthase (UTP-ammonia lyase)